MQRFEGGWSFDVRRGGWSFDPLNGGWACSVYEGAALVADAVGDSAESAQTEALINYISVLRSRLADTGMADEF